MFLASATVVVFTTMLAPVSARAADHKIYGCTVISEPGNYVLATDIVVDTTCLNPDFPGSDDPPEPTGLVGILVSASDVHLNLNGNTVYGDPAGYSEEFFARGISTSAALQSHVRITNGHVDGNGSLGRGIYIDVAKHVTITGVESANNAGEGMLMAFCAACTVNASTFRDNLGAGIQTVFAGDADSDDVSDGNLRLIGNELTGSAFSNGITIGFFGGPHEIIGNTISNNGFNGIAEFFSPEGGHIIRGNRIAANGFSGVRLCTNANTVQANQVLDNGGNGIEIVGGFPCTFGPPGAGNLIQSNRAVGNLGFDAADVNAECVNTWKANQFDTDSEGDGPREGCIQ
ncbi:MAG: right-handed parallel beta-helix repeat-containing protein [Woeseiaceae bacterium]